MGNLDVLCSEIKCSIADVSETLKKITYAEGITYSIFRLIRQKVIHCPNLLF
jgi:hypothetical protein